MSTCNGDDGFGAKDPTQFSTPTTDVEWVHFFSEPRYGVIGMHNDLQCQEVLTKAVRADNCHDILNILKSCSPQNPNVRNSQAVVKFLSLECEAIKAREAIEAKARTENRSVSPDEDDKGLETFLSGLTQISLEFKDIASESKFGQINYGLMLNLIQSLHETDPTWRGSIDATNWRLSCEETSSAKHDLQVQAMKLLELLDGRQAAQSNLDEMLAQNYWPAIEVTLREHYERNADIEKIESFASKLMQAPGIDATAMSLAAGGLFQSAKAKGIQPPDSVRLAGESAVERGANLGFLVLYEYFTATKNIEKAREALENGAKANQGTCIHQLAKLSFLENDNGKARELFERALLHGFDEAHLFLGHIFENGLNVPKNMEKALAHYQAAEKAGFPEAIERFAGWYYAGILNAEIPQGQLYDFEIPGIPKPSREFAQVKSNLIWAHVRFDLAAKAYSERGDQIGAAHAAEWSRVAMKEYEKLASPNLGSLRVQREWNEKQDFLLERRMEREIEVRNEIRQETERRNERIDRSYGNR